MSIVGEAALSLFIQALFDKFTSSDLWVFMRQEKVHEELKKLEKNLKKISAFLDDAEEKQMTSPIVKIWLEDLRDVAYDADDILIEFDTEALQRKLNAEAQPRPSKVPKILDSALSVLSPSAVGSNEKMGSKIKEIAERLDDLEGRRVDLGLKVLAGASSSRVVSNRETSSVMPMAECQVYGRDEDKNKIVEKLLKGENDEFSVIAIVGMGGLGKTTLAQFVYDDTVVNEHFKLKAWVCVSDDFDVKAITRKILESVTGRSCGFDSLNMLQVELKKELTSKKFLIVLDDVWSEKESDWTKLQAPLRGGALGSKVIVTTRNREVAETMGAVEPYFLKQLSKDECWSVFEQHAFKKRTVDRKLVAIGKKIVEKCRGLPLAAKALGGLLRSKQHETEWESILNSEIWKSKVEESGILPELMLSYYHLPSHLKQCFAYCSIFPKDYEFEDEKIVLLWMAQGFLQRSREKKMEDWGKEYFEDLKSRSFFQPSSGTESLYVMHDLINDLAQWVAGETCFRLEGGQYTKHYNSKRVRHSSYVRHSFEGNKKFECFHEFQCLRSFLKFSFDFSPLSLTYDIPPSLLPKLKLLRALSLSGYRIVELPDSIGDLKLLRYLDVSYTFIERLPESVGSLYNLETLMLTGCSRLRKLPEDFGNLINLRHFNNFDANSLEEMPRQISKLTCLQTLSNFVVGKGNRGSSLREIRPLSHLQGELCISKLENVVEIGDAEIANLIGKQDLHKLSLKWSGKFDDSRNGKIEFDVCNMLRPCNMLKELIIKWYIGEKFPTWLEFLNLRELSIFQCPNLQGTLPNRLPSLESLKICSCESLKSIVKEHLPPTLKMMTIQYCENLQNVIDEGEDSSLSVYKENIKSNANASLLEYLQIYGCPSLKFFTSRSRGLHNNLNRIRIDKCPSLVSLRIGWLLPTNLKELWINNCEKLEALPNRMHNFTSLHKVSITECPGIVSIPEEGFPTSLIQLEVSALNICKPLLEWGLHRLTSLKELYISGEWSDWVSFPQGGEDGKMMMQSTSLNRLEIDGFPNLKFLFSKCFQDLSALKFLYITDCFKLTSIPHKGLPPSLLELNVFRCPHWKKDEGQEWFKIHFDDY